MAYKTQHSFFSDLNFKFFLFFNYNSKWTETDLQIFRKHNLNPNFNNAIVSLIPNIILAYENCHYNDTQLKSRYDDDDDDDVIKNYIEDHEFYQEGLTMLKILLRNNQHVFNKERILILGEYETISMYTIIKMHHAHVYPPELAEIVFYANNFNPNEITFGKTLLHNCITHINRPKKIIDILIQHPLLNINYTDKMNIHPISILFKTLDDKYYAKKLINIILDKRGKDLNIGVIMESFPHVKTWSPRQDKFYTKIFLKDRSYYRRFLWKTKRLIFIARLKERNNNVWSLLSLDIISLIFIDFGWEKIEPPKFPQIKDIKLT